MDQEVFAKSEFKSIVATVMSTATILIGIAVGGQKIVNDIRTEFKAEIKSQNDTRDYKQALKDSEQDYKIQALENVNQSK